VSIGFLVSAFFVTVQIPLLRRASELLRIKVLSTESDFITSKMLDSLVCRLMAVMRSSTQFKDILQNYYIGTRTTIEQMLFLICFTDIIALLLYE
jgi:hypothetical protein